jgi:hypothetical protein
MAAFEGAKVHESMTRLETVNTHHILKKKIEKLVAIYQALHHPRCYISLNGEGCYEAVTGSTAKGCAENCSMTCRSLAMYPVKCAVVFACLIKAYDLAGK